MKLKIMVTLIAIMTLGFYVPPISDTTNELDEENEQFQPQLNQISV